MTPLEAKISQFLADAEPLIEPVRIAAQKWVAVSDTQSELATIDDIGTSFAVSWARAADRLKALPSYRSAIEAFERDRIFSEARPAAGHWATFDAVILQSLRHAHSTVDGRLRIHHSKALEQFRAISSSFAASHVRLEARARLLGARVEDEVLRLPDDILLVRLSPAERAERQPFVMAGFGNYGSDPDLLNQSTELRVPITIPLDRAPEGTYVQSAFFKAYNSANQVASRLFGNVVQAILLSFPGNVALGSIELVSAGPAIPYGRAMTSGVPFFGAVSISASHVPRLSIACELVAGGRLADKTLSRALHRFLLGRQRNDSVDKLVDYVIAWEALLLTQEGNALSQELSYRFSINGAALLTKVGPDKDRKLFFRKMQSAYRTRSAIVHGGTDVDRDKGLRSGDFPGIGELCVFLEDGFRASVFWLAGLTASDRPYRQQGGWENLIWPE